MLGLHANMGAVDDLGERFVAAFVGAIEDTGLPADRTLRGAMRAYIEWAVAEVMSYSPKEARVAPDLPTPRWGWDGLE